MIVFKLLKKFLCAGAARKVKKRKKTLKKKLHRFLLKVAFCGVAALTGYMAFLHRRLILAKLKGEELPEEEKKKCPVFKLPFLKKA